MTYYPYGKEKFRHTRVGFSSAWPVDQACCQGTNTSNTLQENFGRQEENFEVHYNDAVQVLAQKYEEQLEALGEEKRQKLEALYEQLVNCGKHLDTCKELTDETQELFLENDKAEFMKVKSFNCQSAFGCLQVVPIWEVPSSLIARENLGCSVRGAVTPPGAWHGGIDLVGQQSRGGNAEADL